MLRRIGMAQGRTAIAQAASERLLRCLERLERGEIALTTPDGKTRHFRGPLPGERATIRFHDWRLFRSIILKGDLAFAQGYRDGLWDSDDLCALVSLALSNKSVFEGFVIEGVLSRSLSVVKSFLRRNSLRGSRHNIQAHYDLGNDFYALWLDPSMTYSSALFETEGDTLQVAQDNKYNRILGRLGTSAGSILEIGCGWGGFAEHALARGDFSIRGITLSRAQRDYVQQRLGHNADIALQDYRHQRGRFDHIVSIEMFEAVGERYWPLYFQQVAALLKRNGRAVIQTITINDADFPRYRRGGDFIRSYIFPGGLLPSWMRFRQEAQQANLTVRDAFRFGQDYARTLTLWLARFDAQRAQVKNLGFDDGFIRLWRFYLASCAAGFKTGHTDVMQVELRHA